MKNCQWMYYIALLVTMSSGQGVYAQTDEVEQIKPEVLEQLAKTGNPDAQFDLGLRLLTGDGLPKDESRAAIWLQKAADQNHLPGMNAVGTLYETGTGVVKDEKKAFDWYMKAAEYGFPLAQQNLAECYDLGKGVVKNPAEAVKWILSAANQDFAPSQALYAWKLEMGDGLDKNTREAATWYLRAAQNGLVRAMTRLAYLYYTGKGVPLDYYRAEAWYRRAARSDDAMARNDLAWFLSVCPDDNFHDGSAAVDVARSSLEKLEKEDYQVVDTLAAALARNGKYGEAVQVQMKAIVMFGEDSKDKKPLSEQERETLEQELTSRLQIYKKQQPYTEVDVKPEKGTKPLIGDRILQEEYRPRKPKSRDDDDGDSPSTVIS